MSLNNTVKYSCRFCSDTSGDSILETKDIYENLYQIIRCNNCRAFFLWPPPDDKTLQIAYDITYYGKNVSKFNFSFIEKGIDLFRRCRAKKISNYLPTNGRVLDIGCGNGNFLKYLVNYKSAEIFGIELNEMAARRAMKIPEIKIKSSPLTNDDFSPDYFDLITMFHVFEHLPFPSETLSIITKILKPGGVIAVSFPNIVSWQARCFKGNWFHLDPPRHLLFFAPDDFISMMKKYNFDCLNISHFSLEQNPFGYTQSVLNKLCKKRDLLYEFLKGNRDYMQNDSSFIIALHLIFFIATYPFFILLSMLESIFQRGGTISFIFLKSKK